MAIWTEDFVNYFDQSNLNCPCPGIGTRPTISSTEQKRWVGRFLSIAKWGSAGEHLKWSQHQDHEFITLLCHNDILLCKSLYLNCLQVCLNGLLLCHEVLWLVSLPCPFPHQGDHLYHHQHCPDPDPRHPHHYIPHRRHLPFRINLFRMTTPVSGDNLLVLYKSVLTSCYRHYATGETRNHQPKPWIPRTASNLWRNSGGKSTSNVI